MTTMNNKYQGHFLKEYSPYPQGKYISILIVRKLESEAIFRTEGSGEGLNKEIVSSGIANKENIPRVVISKRKQIAVERRSGRELLRNLSLLPEKCELNTNSPCGECIDCMLYGYAVGDGGAQKSRILSDDAFSLHSAYDITGVKTFNALYETGTMRDKEGNASSSINEDEYVRPESVFIDIEVGKDLTFEEFQYAFGNILRSKRYGAISSRIGSVKNIPLMLIFSDNELFSNLELTQAIYDIIKGEKESLQFPLNEIDIFNALKRAVDLLLKDFPGRATIVDQEDLANFQKEITDLYQSDRIKTTLEDLQSKYGNGTSSSKRKKSKKKKE